MDGGLEHGEAGAIDGESQSRGNAISERSIGPVHGLQQPQPRLAGIPLDCKRGYGEPRSSPYRNILGSPTPQAMTVRSSSGMDPSYNGHLTDYAFRWTTAQGMVSLGLLPGSISSSARGVSPDGSTVVGASGRTFLWTVANGMQDLGVLPRRRQGSGADGVSDGQGSSGR